MGRIEIEPKARLSDSEVDLADYGGNLAGGYPAAVSLLCSSVPSFVIVGV